MGRAAREYLTALRQQFRDLMIDFARLPFVLQAARQRCGSPTRLSAAFNRIAPPSKLPCRWSNCATTGLAKIVGNNKHCVVVLSVKRKPPRLVQTRINTVFVPQEAFLVSKKREFSRLAQRLALSPSAVISSIDWEQDCTLCQAEELSLALCSSLHARLRQNLNGPQHNIILDGLPCRRLVPFSNRLDNGRMEYLKICRQRRRTPELEI